MADAYGAFYEFYSIHKALSLKTRSFAKMDKLRWLQLQTVKLTGSYKNFPELKWLCWHWYHLKMIPYVLLMSSLVDIDMSYGDLIKFELPMFAQDLKTIGGLKNISKLNLTGCKKLCKASSSKKYVKHERLKALRIGGGDLTNRNQWEFMLCLLMNVVNYFKENEDRGVDVLIFNTAHWWNYYKTKLGAFDFVMMYRANSTTTVIKRFLGSIWVECFMQVQNFKCLQ
ncbi:toll/interleukin-1 receptor (TIR) domain-containing protein [Artemisia annua]|uniref:Toll/interleukin-1 receptor (TIR) domain-containing protein n=1 Tax=Artemisia annua TaxID=35608 RepID=A0A2U1M1S2_ARTAN|nr:toll/interleukin-1 receptor (TIR) domain-containing protein [Artemisia annua]